MPISETIAGVASSISALARLGSEMSRANSAADGKTMLAEFQNCIIQANQNTMAAQVEGASLLERNRHLETEIVKLKNWETEAARYELKEVAPQVFAYAVKEPMRGAEPAHWLCCRCYGDGKKSILHLQQEPYGAKIYLCHACGSQIKIRVHVPPIQVNRRPPPDWRA